MRGKDVVISAVGHSALVLILTIAVSAACWALAPMVGLRPGNGASAQQAMSPDMQADVPDASTAYDDGPRIQLVQRSGTIRCHASMAAEIEMDSGQDPAPLQIENPSESPYPIRVSIVRNSNAQSIYSSPVIQPGERLESAALREALQPGEHPCSVTFDTIHGDTQKTIAQASGSIIIKVDS